MSPLSISTKHQSDITYIITQHTHSRQVPFYLASIESRQAYESQGYTLCRLSSCENKLRRMAAYQVIYFLRTDYIFFFNCQF